MPSFFSNRRLIFLLVSSIIMVVVVGVTLQERSQLTWSEQFTQDSIGFFQSMVYKPARYAAGFFENVNEIRQVHTENQKLKKQLQENAQLMAKIRELEADNESLREAFDAQEALGDYELRQAEVISRSPDRWYQQIRINRGQQHGIEHNMAVVTADGLVGRINRVSQFSSTVELISDVNRTVQISAVVQGDESIYGLIERYDSDEEALYFREIPKGAEIEEGQTVITSGLGGLFPHGLYIGEVTEVEEDEYGLNQVALVEPAANLYELDHVLVVERSMISEEDLPSIDAINEGQEEGSSAESEDRNNEGGTDS